MSNQEIDTLALESDSKCEPQVEVSLEEAVLQKWEIDQMRVEEKLFAQIRDFNIGDLWDKNTEFLKAGKGLNRVWLLDQGIN